GNDIASVAERRMLPWDRRAPALRIPDLIRNHTVFKPNTYFFCRSWGSNFQRIADNDIASVAERRMLPWDRRAPALRIPDFDPESYCIQTKHLFLLSELGLQLPSVGAGSPTSQRTKDSHIILIHNIF